MQRFLPAALLIAFLFCYLGWGTRGDFIFRIEQELLFSGNTERSAFFHPAILLPLGGQVLLLLAVLLPHPRRWMLLTGTALCGCLVLMILLAGSLSANARTILSTLPYLGLAVVAFRRPARPAA